jgi:leucine dehydrogenase
LIVADIASENVKKVVDTTGATSVPPDSIFDVDADVFAPCALGGILNDETIPRLRVSIVCGAANNQLLEDRHGGALLARNILYVPDYVANAGGIINGIRELRTYATKELASEVETIYATTTEVLNLARAQGIPPSQAADVLARARLQR